MQSLRIESMASILCKHINVCMKSNFIKINHKKFLQLASIRLCSKSSSPHEQQETSSSSTKESDAASLKPNPSGNKKAIGLTLDEDFNSLTIKKSNSPSGIIGLEALSVHKVGKWVTVYHFPFIVVARMMARAKLFQTIIACTTVPITFVMSLTGLCSEQTFTYYAFVSMFACAMLYVFGNIFRRLVGIAYISEDGKMARFAHLTFFGRRQESYVQVEDIIPLKYSNEILRDFYCKIERLSNDEVLYLCLKFGGIVNNNGFEKVFGPGSAEPKG